MSPLEKSLEKLNDLWRKKLFETIVGFEVGVFIGTSLIL